jgi:hypothetical protein
MRATKVIPIIAAAVAFASIDTGAASGEIGLYGIVEKVVFEPNEQAPERMQLWGAFAYAESRQGDVVSAVQRGYLYFRIPDNSYSPREVVLAEWKDLKSVAGTGQVVGFGHYGYIGGFQDLDPARQTNYLLELHPGGGRSTDLRVRPATEAPANPAAYLTDTGVVRVPDSGSRANVVRRIKTALAAK